MHNFCPSQLPCTVWKPLYGLVVSFPFKVSEEVCVPRNVYCTLNEILLVLKAPLGSNFVPLLQFRPNPRLWTSHTAGKDWSKASTLWLNSRSAILRLDFLPFVPPAWTQSLLRGSPLPFYLYDCPVREVRLRVCDEHPAPMANWGFQPGS